MIEKTVYGRVLFLGLRNNYSNYLEKDTDGSK